MRPARKSSSEQVVKVDERGSETSQTRWARIARRAYELAQQRGFAPGAELSDWLQAEQEIDAAEQQRQASRSQNQRTR